MSSPGFVSRLLSAFRRKPPVMSPPPVETPIARPTIVKPSAPLHPIATRAVDATASGPIVVAPQPVASALPVAPRVPSPAVTAFVDQVRQLPLFSGTAMQLLKSAGQEDITTSELARMISTDAGLVAQLLRIVNSPVYGLPARCGTVANAIAVLGFAQVRRTVSAAVTHGPLKTYLRDSRSVQAFFRHQLLCAAMARHLATQRGLDGEVAYVAGLMHEVGCLAILIKHPHLTDVLLRVDGQNGQLGTRQERAHFGFDHAEVGGALLAKWGLPAPIVEAAYDHESAEQPADPMSAAVWRGNLLARDMIDEPDELEAPLPWMAAVGLSVEDRARMLAEISALGA